MRKIFVSMLGTTKYTPCHYKIENWTSELVTFVQEALINFFCKDWSENDRIFIFCTKEAEENNWNDGGNFSEGLCSRLKRLNLKTPIEKVSIPTGKTENEVMEIFMKMVDHLENEDEVILDVTHAFRSIPILMIVALNYAKVLKNIQVLGIYYGALEAVGDPKYIDNLPEEERIIPVFNLTSYDYILDWASAIDIFLKSGWSEKIKEVLKRKLTPIFKGEETGAKDIAKKLSEFGDKLNSFCKNLIAVRGREIEEKNFNFGSYLNLLKQIDLIPPLKPLISMLEPELINFDSPQISKGFEAVKWCLGHGLIPQAYIFLLESTLTELCKMHNQDPLDEEERKAWSGILHLIASKKEDSKIRKILEKEGEKLKELAEKVEPLREHRNDFMHGGWRKNSSKAKTLLQAINGYYPSITKAIKEYKEDFSSKAIFVLSHEPTDSQKKELKEKWNCNEIVTMPDDIKKVWESVSPDSSTVEIKPVIDWLERIANPGDIIVVQGDYGATFKVVKWAKEHLCVPVYATTRRIVEEKVSENSVEQKRIFKHCRFRKYEI